MKTASTSVVTGCDVILQKLVTSLKTLRKVRTILRSAMSVRTVTHAVASLESVEAEDIALSSSIFQSFWPAYLLVALHVVVSSVLCSV